MALIINKSGEEKVNLELTGRLDTVTSPELEKVLDGILDSVKSLVFDFAKLEYISSAGLRVILKAQKAIKGKGKMKLVNVNADVMEVFEMTGFSSFLNIE